MKGGARKSGVEGVHEEGTAVPQPTGRASLGSSAPIMDLEGLSREDREILLAGCLINSYAR